MHPALVQISGRVIWLQALGVPPQAFVAAVQVHPAAWQAADPVPAPVGEE